MKILVDLKAEKTCTVDSMPAFLRPYTKRGSYLIQNFGNNWEIPHVHLHQIHWKKTSYLKYTAED